MKQNKKEELQSRRQFFKKAAKATLPILGAVVLANMPMIAQASNGSSTGCEACTGLCTGCTGCTSCSGLCEGECLGCTGCSLNCYGSPK